MILATELRIGNLILFSPLGKAAVNTRAVTVKSILDKSVIVNDNGLDLELFYGSASTKPIPLTEEWLKRFGFREELNASKTTTLYIYDIMSLAHRENGEYSCAIHTLLTYPLPVKVKYVHTLQNLFFALTQSELTISTTPTK